MAANREREFGRFTIGPFVVMFRPLHGIYTRYSIEIEGVEIRAQISYPEEADGWVGYAQAIRDKKLSPAAQDAFRGHCGTLGRQVTPADLRMADPLAKHYYGAPRGRPRKEPSA